MSAIENVINPNLYGIVDMGSNGIRFSITDMCPSTARIMPIVYQDRAGISLYDARFSTTGSGTDGEGVTAQGLIPKSTMLQVVTRLSHFKTICADFGVPPDNVHVLATEATRTAPNSEEFRKQIKDRTGWEVRILSKEDEGRLGAMGVASSSASVAGLVMDMGGGSVQITWMIEKDGVITTSPRGSFSFPYGAAALTRRLEQVQGRGKGKGSKAEQELRDEMKNNFQHAYRQLEVPPSLLQAAERRGGFDLYLCGGGFRGWGYLLMSQSKFGAYPIPIVNGYRTSRGEFYDTSTVMDIVSKKDVKIFGVSKRRESQMPAIALLVNVLMDALPVIKNIQFCQGGVREGFLFDKLPAEIRAQDPLLVATSPYAPPSREAIKELLISALPETSSLIASRCPPESFSPNLLAALSNLLFAHSRVPRESRSAAALHSTTTGILASTNSLTHVDRAIVALILCERWSGDLAPAEEMFQYRLDQLLSAQERWWCQYLGRVASLIGIVYPSGLVPKDNWRVRLETRWDIVTKKKGRDDMLCLRIILDGTDTVLTETMRDSLRDTGEKIEKTGKKNWIHVPEGDYGVRVGVDIMG
ncbi:hypothetical protein MPDQ_002590 [Monascus purpureus]|uniref:Uncharacterized protein n=1 Tax=Monascus purpureus TaxID=5098 RepID=A0A507QK67_MONPU|nr:hypothetical protein MPDQ_002590 [Monascus purpureus]BDD61056.1 hypothetical protein MAP00_006135 [Monascus purpureus]